MYLINYIYLKEIYLNPYLCYRVLCLYRIIIGLISVYCFIQNNMISIEELLDKFLYYYEQQFSEDIILTDRFRHYNPHGKGKGSKFETWESGSPNNNNNNSENLQPAAEDDNTKKRKSNKKGKNPTKKSKKDNNVSSTGSQLSRKRASQVNTLLRQKRLQKLRLYFRKLKKKTLGPKFRFRDPKRKKWIDPESYHGQAPIQVMASKTMRVYQDGPLRYTYFCHAYRRSKRYCKVTYPDGTSLYMYSPEKLMKHIEFNRHNTWLGYQMKPKFMMGNYYRTHFDPFRKKKINDIINRVHSSHPYKKISINDLINKDK